LKQDITKVFKRGASHSVRIPSKIWDYLMWRDGDVCSIVCDQKRLVVERIPLEKYREMTLTVSGEGA